MNNMTPELKTLTDTQLRQVMHMNLDYLTIIFDEMRRRVRRAEAK